MIVVNVSTSFPGFHSVSKKLAIRFFPKVYFANALSVVTKHGLRGRLLVHISIKFLLRWPLFLYSLPSDTQGLALVGWRITGVTSFFRYTKCLCVSMYATFLIAQLSNILSIFRATKIMMF